MKKIFVNNNEIKLTKNDLPMLIHGEDHAGASFYTISLIVNLFKQGCKIIVLCGYHMAREQLEQQVENFDDKVVFYTKEKDEIYNFKKALLSFDDNDNNIVLLKNIELFTEDVVSVALQRQKYIISGDFNKCIFRDKILEKFFTTKIFFSSFPNIDIPSLNKHEGFLVSSIIQGITKSEV